MNLLQAVNEEMDERQVPAPRVLMAPNKNRSELFTMTTEPELTSTFMTGEPDSRTTDLLTTSRLINATC